MTAEQGYRDLPRGGPRVRTDVVDVYVFRARTAAVAPSEPGGFEFLQLLRADDPLAGTWHPVMGHVEPGETAVQCAVRELHEELGLRPGEPPVLGMWALEQVHPFFIAAIDCIVMSPRFAVLVGAGWQPTLSAEHTAWRWVGQDEPDKFMWPGQRAAVREIVESLMVDGAVCAEWVRVK